LKKFSHKNIFIDVSKRENIHEIVNSTVIDTGRLENSTISIGKDNKGPYVSFFDIWDFDYIGENQLNQGNASLRSVLSSLMNLVGKNKIGFYDRFHLDNSAIKKELKRRGNH